MKGVYTAIPLALLATVAQAELHLSSQHKESRNVGFANSHGSRDSLGQKRNLVVGDDFAGDGFNLPSADDYVPFDKDDGVFDAGSQPSPINSAIGGPHNFNQQDGPYNDSGHNKIDGGINNDNIVISPVNNQQAQQATEGTEISPPPEHPHGPPPPAEHEPEQLPPQQHSEPKQSIPTGPGTPVDTPEGNPKGAYQPPAAPQGPAPVPAPVPAPEPAIPAHGPAPVPVAEPAPPAYGPSPVAAPRPGAPAYGPAPVPVPDPAPPAHDPVPVPAPAEPSAQTGSKGPGAYQQPPCPEFEDGTHHMPMPEDGEPPVLPIVVPKPQPEIPSEGTVYQPPHPPAPQSPPQPHDDPVPYPKGQGHLPEPDHEEGHPHGTYPLPEQPENDHDLVPVPEPDHEKDHPHGTYPLPEQPAHDHDVVPVSEPDDEEDHPHGTYPLPEQPEHDHDFVPVPEKPDTEPEIYKPFPPGRQYGKPPYVTPSSTFGAQPKSSQVPSSIRYASHQASSTPCSRSAKPSMPSTLTGAPSVSQTPTPTGPSTSSLPSTFIGGGSFLAAPEGFTLAVLGALAFLL